MKPFVVLFLLALAVVMFATAAILGADPRAPRIQNWGLSSLASAGFVYVAPIP